MRNVLEPAVRDCVTAVSSTFQAVFDDIEAWRVEIERRVSKVPVTSADIDELTERLVVPALSRDNAVIIGAGFVAAPGFLADTEWHLAWWLGHANTFGIGSAEPSIRRLDAVEDPLSDSFRDYTTLEWWREPAATGAAHITGPYVDYLCTDDYTLTLTVSVLHDGRMIGVVGADLYVNEVERLLLPRVRAIGAQATIINNSRRVVVSTDAHLPTGSILNIDGLDVVPCGETSLSLVR